MTASIQSLLEERTRSAIRVKATGAGNPSIGATRLGGCPDVPADFQWPWFSGKESSGERYSVPLTFLGQFHCADLVPLDLEHLLPTHGVLSFFYEADRQPWGIQCTDKGSSRVYWFPEEDCLQPMEPPVDLRSQLHLRSCGVSLRQVSTCPDWVDLNLPQEYSYAYRQAIAGWPVPKEAGIQLLGWPMTIQNSMPAEVELITNGYGTGGSRRIPPKVREQAKTIGPERWQLLLQYSPPRQWPKLKFFDCGMIYIWIPKEDLAARNFDRIWTVLQCY